MKKNGFNPDDFEAAYVLTDAGSMGYAFNKNCPDALIQAFQQSLTKVKKSPRFNQILDSYLK